MCFVNEAVLNEIGGKDHSGTRSQRVPGIFGMNFQAVSTAQKLPTSDGLTGGYLPGGTVPGPLLSKALDFVNTSVGKMVATITADGLAKSTTIILSAKHGQSPQDPADLTRIPDDRFSTRSMQPGPQPTPGVATSSHSQSTTTRCSCG